MIRSLIAHTASRTWSAYGRSKTNKLIEFEDEHANSLKMRKDNGRALRIRIKARSRQVSLCPYLLLLVTLVIACSTAGGQFQAGRQALLRGEPEIAVTYFTAAADQNPNYVYVIEN